MNQDEDIFIVELTRNQLGILETEARIRADFCEENEGVSGSGLEYREEKVEVLGTLEALGAAKLKVIPA